MIRACIFDLDGVIVDTAQYHFLAWKELADELNIPFTERENENLKGVGRMESLEYILSLGNKSLDAASLEKLAVSKNERYKTFIKQLTPEDILPGVASFLDELKHESILIGLGSSSKNARPVLECLEIMDYFNVIVDGTDITRSKPDPEVFVLGAKALDVLPVDTVVFEDAKAGIEAALSGGFKSVGVGDAEELKAADHVIDNFESFGINELRKAFS